jgi:hypothetical protein
MVMVTVVAIGLVRPTRGTIQGLRGIFHYFIRMIAKCELLFAPQECLFVPFVLSDSIDLRFE